MAVAPALRLGEGVFSPGGSRMRITSWSCATTLVLLPFASVITY
jgi:hypothetical protein